MYHLIFLNYTADFDGIGTLRLLKAIRLLDIKDSIDFIKHPIGNLW